MFVTLSKSKNGMSWVFFVGILMEWQFRMFWWWVFMLWMPSRIFCRNFIDITIRWFDGSGQSWTTRSIDVIHDVGFGDLFAYLWFNEVAKLIYKNMFDVRNKSKKTNTIHIFFARNTHSNTNILHMHYYYKWYYINCFD